MKKEIINCLVWYANAVSETTQYEYWSDEHCRKNINEDTKTFLEELKNHIDWNNLTAEECDELHLREWSTDEDIDEEIANLQKPDAKYRLNEGQTLEDKIAGLERTKGIRLIPLYLLPIVPIGTELISIFGEVVKFDGNNVDNDIRFGCIPFGIKIVGDSNA